MHLEGADLQTYSRIGVLFFDEYRRKAVKESSFIQRCLGSYKDNFILRAGLCFAFLTALPQMSVLGTIGAVLGWTAVTTAVLFNAHVKPMGLKAVEAFNRDITSGILTDRYEKEMENLNDFETKMMRAGFDPIHSVGHETLRAETLKATFKKQAERAAFIASQLVGQSAAPAPDAPGA